MRSCYAECRWEGGSPVFPFAIQCHPSPCVNSQSSYPRRDRVVSRGRRGLSRETDYLREAAGDRRERSELAEVPLKTLPDICRDLDAFGQSKLGRLRRRGANSQAWVMGRSDSSAAVGMCRPLRGVVDVLPLTDGCPVPLGLGAEFLY